MNFLVSSTTLLRQLNGINGVIANNPVIPILENFLFEIEPNKLTVTASDLETSVVAEITVEASETGKIAVPAKILLDTLKNLPEQPVNFVIDDETYTIELSSDNGRYKLAGENAADFPRVPEPDGNTEKVEMNSAVLGRAINKTLFATSNDELRPAMTGVYLSLSESNVTFVATDGHRLVKCQRVDVASSKEASIIVPKKSLNLLKNVLSSETVDVEMNYNSSNAFFNFGNIKMVCRLIDERYPDYNNVIPVDNPNKMIIDRSELLSSVKRIAIYANKTTHQIRFKLAGSELQISAEDLDFSNEANERLSCEYEGEDLEIGFNARFLMEILSNLSSNQVVLELSTPNRAGILLPVDKEDNEELLMLVMPVMLNNYV